MVPRLYWNQDAVAGRLDDAAMDRGHIVLGFPYAQRPSTPDSKEGPWFRNLNMRMHGEHQLSPIDD